MDLLDVMRACLRRWYVSIPILVFTFGIALGQYQGALPQYTGTTSVVVVPSRDLVVSRGQQSLGGDPVITPFNGNNGSSTLAGMLRTALNTSTVRGQLFPEGGVALQATRDTQEDSALVSITVISNDEARAVAALETVQTRINDVAVQLQATAGVPSKQMLTTIPGGPADPPVEDHPDRIRAVVATSLAGAVLAVVASVLVQALARGRKPKAPSPSTDRRPSQVDLTSPAELPWDSVAAAPGAGGLSADHGPRAARRGNAGR